MRTYAPDFAVQAPDFAVPARAFCLIDQPSPWVVELPFDLCVLFVRGAFRETERAACREIRQQRLEFSQQQDNEGRLAGHPYPISQLSSNIHVRRVANKAHPRWCYRKARVDVMVQQQWLTGQTAPEACYLYRM